MLRQAQQDGLLALIVLKIQVLCSFRAGSGRGGRPPPVQLMRNPVLLILGLVVGLAGPVAAQPAAAAAHPDVPTAFDVAGLHLVLNEEAQRLVQQKADGLCRHQPSFQARVDLADAAFPIIDRVLKEEGVPLDFRYLALQESALQGDAQSAHQAVGYWQLKRETATDLGLVVNDAVDERQHLAASTRAAARYLARNNHSLHNWLNALLSYNTGLGGVKAYTLPSDFEATQMAVTEATSPYVLMFLAQKIAFEPACGQNPRPVLRLLEFPAAAGQTLAAQALALHTEPENLAVHNHWLLTPEVPADRPYTLIVPVGDITQQAGVLANQRLQSRAELLALPAVAANPAEVRLNDLRALIALPGETTADLARRGNRRLGEFLRDNELSGFDVAVVGRPYYLESKRDVAAVEYHVLQPGETLFDVAQKYGLRKKAILAKNHLAPVSELRPGLVLWLQHVRPREVAAEYRTLPDGVALERAPGEPSPAATIPSALAAAVPNQRPASNLARPNRDSEEGWGDALPAVLPASNPAAASGPAVASGGAAAPVPIVAAAPPGPPSTLPPPAPAPAPAPLADEPARPEPVARPVAAVLPPPAGPLHPNAVPAVVPAAPVVAPVAAPAAGATHRVEPGETLYAVGRRYQVPPATLMALNHLTPPANLAVGQVLLLKAGEPGPPQAAVAAGSAAIQPAGRRNPALYVPKTVALAPPVAPAATAAATQHTVAAGETLYSIARRYNLKVADLQAWNAKLDPNVRVGEVLRLQAPGKQ